jgi:hypothetical protein
VSCADTIDADSTQATIAAASIEVFMVIFPYRANKVMFSLLSATDGEMHDVQYEDKPE